jgi:hypothetical protein
MSSPLGTELAQEVVCIVHRNPVDALPAGQQDVPDLLHTRVAAPALAVDRGMTVEDLEQPVPFHPGQLVRPERPAEIGVIDVRDSVNLSHGVHIGLNGLGQALRDAWHDHSRDVESVHVDGFPLIPGGQLLTGDEQERGIHQVGQGLRIREHVVIGEYKEGVAVLLVPAGHGLRGRVPVALCRMGVSVPLEPTEPLQLGHLELPVLLRHPGRGNAAQSSQRERMGQGRPASDPPPAGAVVWGEKSWSGPAHCVLAVGVDENSSAAAGPLLPIHRGRLTVYPIAFLRNERTLPS